MDAYELPRECMLDFVRHAFVTGLGVLERGLSGEAGTGSFADGDVISHADLCLVSL